MKICFKIPSWYLVVNIQSQAYKNHKKQESWVAIVWSILTHLRVTKRNTWEFLRKAVTLMSFRENYRHATCYVGHFSQGISVPAGPLDMQKIGHQREGAECLFMHKSPQGFWVDLCLYMSFTTPPW